MIEIEVLSTGKLGAQVAVYVDENPEPLVFNMTSRGFRYVPGYAVQMLRGDVIQLNMGQEPKLSRELNA